MPYKFVEQKYFYNTIKKVVYTTKNKKVYTTKIYRKNCPRQILRLKVWGTNWSRYSNLCIKDASESTDHF